MSAQCVAVIGAGLAGLKLASDLVSSGASVTVFDKSRGLGGRMSTRRGDAWACDHGAQYFTARSAEFQRQLACWESAGAVARWQPRLKVFGEAAVRDGGLAVPRFVATPGMTAVARLIAQGLEVRLQSTVSAVERDGSQYRLRTAEGGELAQRFDSVVLAVPAPQAAPLLEMLSPELASVAVSARMQACWSLMLRLDQQPDIDFDAAFVNLGLLRWVARNSSKPQRDGGQIWLLHASPEWSEAHVEDSPDSVTTAMLDAFCRLGVKSSPEVLAIHRWRYAFTDSAVPDACVWDPDLRIGMCGDWLAGGRVEGAWRSGMALAARMGGG